MSPEVVCLTDIILTEHDNYNNFVLYIAFFDINLVQKRLKQHCQTHLTPANTSILVNHRCFFWGAFLAEYPANEA